MLFWFSGTGNSRHVAALIARYTQDTTQNIATAMQQKKFEYTLKSGEALGIVCPTYFWGVPAIVDQFLSELSLTCSERPYTYAVFTCGGSSLNAVSLVRKHFPVDYFESVTMPDNFIIKYDMPDPADIKTCLRQADVALNRVYGIINRRETPKHNSASLFGIVATKSAYPGYDKLRHTSAFHVNDACIGCGLCAEICPDLAISLSDGKPFWTAPMCSLCLACVHRCPASAIQFGSKTAKRRRYMHPDLAAVPAKG